MIVIGITGKYCAGKTTVCEYMTSKSFKYESLSDELREILKKEGLESSRQNLISKGNELRKKSGNGFLAKSIIARMSRDKNYVIDSLRNPQEIREFQNLGSFHLWNITSLEENKFERILKRKREGDPKTLKEFREMEKKESFSSDASDQQLDECARMAEYTIENNGTLGELFQKVDSLLLNTPADLKRPEELTVQQVAQRFGTSDQVVYYWIEHRIIRSRRINPGMPHWITLRATDEQQLREWVRKSRRIQPVS